MLFNNDEYIKIIDKIKSQIRDDQYRAVLGANGEMIKLYWSIGSTINEKSVWGNKFIENLSKAFGLCFRLEYIYCIAIQRCTLSRDIRHDFPDSTGYSVRNLKYMAKCAKIYPDKTLIVQRGVAQLPWRHNVDDIKNRIFGEMD
jgi:hypothetical protein